MIAYHGFREGPSILGTRTTLRYLFNAPIAIPVGAYTRLRSLGSPIRLITQQLLHEFGKNFGDQPPSPNRLLLAVAEAYWLATVLRAHWTSSGVFVTTGPLTFVCVRYDMRMLIHATVRERWNQFRFDYPTSNAKTMITQACIDNLAYGLDVYLLHRRQRQLQMPAKAWLVMTKSNQLQIDLHYADGRIDTNVVVVPADKGPELS